MDTAKWKLSGDRWLQPIPQPPEHAWGFLGNVPDVNITAMSASYGRLVALYGPIFKLNLLNKHIIILSSQELINEVCDESRFSKMLGVLKEVRLALGDGLITSLTTEHNWKLAHKLLMTSFGPMAIRDMFPSMLDITSQMILKLERMGPSHVFDASDIFTRLSLDIIALIGFDYRFNSFYTDTTHPFVSSLMGMLKEASRRSTRSNLGNKVRFWAWRDFQRHSNTMHRLCDEIIEDRRKNPKDVNDILDVMLTARDKETGEGLSDENIRFNVETMLAAGHETTSGLLSFTFWELLKHPDKLQKAIAEVDSVLADDELRVEHLPKLKYVDAVLKESLRLHPPAAQIAVHPTGGNGVLAGKYAYSSTDIFVLNLVDLHRDPLVWGPDAITFRPERMLDGGFESLPPNSWVPFGKGARACIGRAFAIQEASMAIALVLQRCQVELADPTYELKVEQTVTQNPVGLFLKARLRPGWVSQGSFGGRSSVSASPPSVQLRPLLPQATARSSRSPEGASLTILYGSNSGTCKSFAEDVQAAAPSFGFVADKIQTLDDAAGNLPQGRPIIIITATYNGQPTDDAKKFVSWLESSTGNTTKLQGVIYTLLGVGNSDYVTTYQRVPKLIDALMEHSGACKFAPVGLANVAEDVYGAFDEWLQDIWKALQAYTAAQTESKPLELEIQLKDRLGSTSEKNMILGTVREHREIANDGLGYVKKHIEIVLPNGMSYSPGDYLSILPTNNGPTIRRVLNRFSLLADATITFKNSKKSYLPNEKPEHVYALLEHYVELNFPASRKQLAILAEVTKNEAEKLEVDRLATSVFKTEVLDKRASVIDILEAFPSCSLPFATFINMLPPLQARQFSISSSALAVKAGNIVTITYDVLAAPSLSNPKRTHFGVASTYLSGLHPDDKIHCSIRPNTSNFYLPSDSTLPVILIAAGTGIAPMRSFIQERAAIACAGGNTPVGKAIFYFGCRHPRKDYLYKPELLSWEKLGVVQMRPCFSRYPRASAGFRYVPERIWAEREELKALFEVGAKVFVCGSASKLARSTEEVCERIYREVSGCGAKEAREWLEGQKGGRYVSEVFH